MNSNDKATQRVGEDILATYFKEINNIPLLSRTEEGALGRRAAGGDLAAREKLIQANLRFVVKVAKEFHTHGLSLEDLVSEGNIGLMEAARHFDPQRGNRFISYAVWWIRQAITKAIAEKSRLIRLPAHKAEELLQIMKVHEQLRAERHQKPEVEAIAQRLHRDRNSVIELLTISRELVSLEAPGSFEDEASPLGDIIEDRTNALPEISLLEGCLREDINRALGSLAPRESEILQCRLGLNGKKPMTLKALGSRYKLSRERIRQIEQKAMRRLKLRRPLLEATR